MSKVASLPAPAERVPERTPYLHSDTWLISLCADDSQMVLLMRHLHRVHNVVSIADLDAAGWNVINTYRDEIPHAKLDAFFRKLGKKRRDTGSRCQDSAKILAFTPARL